MPAAWILPGAAAAGALLWLAAPRPVPHLLWNTTASAPIGLWALSSPRLVRAGTWLALRPPPSLGRWLDGRGALPAGVLLLKQAAALAPSQVCRRADVISIDGTPRARASPADRLGRPLPQWRGCRRLAADEVFVLNAAPGSLDSRYFGPLPLAAIVARATPLICSRSPTDAL